MDKIIDQIGGETAVRHLVETFYDLIETKPEGENIRLLHTRGHGIPHARIEQFNFLSAFFGGRRHYYEKHGHMDVKLMHAHIPITQQDAENWLMCMEQALDTCGHQEPVKTRLMTSFERVANALVNNGKPITDAPSA